MIDLLFVFGSFSEGQEHFNKIAGVIEETQTGYVNGSVYRLRVGFPAFFDEGLSLVRGSLVRLSKPEVQLALLDQFHAIQPGNPEKSIYIRKLLEVKLESGEIAKANVYCLSPNQLSSAKLIETGDWQRELQEKPALTHRLTDRQKAFIKKLAITPSRTAVPIDLGLYRELINLELIVDKGRRLALTPLGQDVHRFLN